MYRRWSLSCNSLVLPSVYFLLESWSKIYCNQASETYKWQTTNKLSHAFPLTGIFFNEGFPDFTTSVYFKDNYWNNQKTVLTRSSVPNNSIHQDHKKKSHLIATHSMAVKDSNLLIFFSCHVIQTLICLHVSYLGVKTSTLQKVDDFRGEWCPSQATLAPVLSAIYPEVMWMKHQT